MPPARLSVLDWAVMVSTWSGMMTEVSCPDRGHRPDSLGPGAPAARPRRAGCPPSAFIEDRREAEPRVDHDRVRDPADGRLRLAVGDPRPGRPRHRLRVELQPVASHGPTDVGVRVVDVPAACRARSAPGSESTSEILRARRSSTIASTSGSPARSTPGIRIVRCHPREPALRSPEFSRRARVRH